jgi:hypothetical protein
MIWANANYDQQAAWHQMPVGAFRAKGKWIYISSDEI